MGRRARRERSHYETPRRGTRGPEQPDDASADRAAVAPDLVSMARVLRSRPIRAPRRTHRASAPNSSALLGRRPPPEVDRDAAAGAARRGAVRRARELAAAALDRLLQADRRTPRRPSRWSRSPSRRCDGARAFGRMAEAASRSPGDTVLLSGRVNHEPGWWVVAHAVDGRGASRLPSGGGDRGAGTGAAAEVDEGSWSSSAATASEVITVPVRGGALGHGGRQPEPVGRGPDGGQVAGRVRRLPVLAERSRPRADAPRRAAPSVQLLNSLRPRVGDSRASPCSSGGGSSRRGGEGAAPAGPPLPRIHDLRRHAVRRVRTACRPRAMNVDGGGRLRPTVVPVGESGGFSTDPADGVLGGRGLPSVEASSERQ